MSSPQDQANLAALAFQKAQQEAQRKALETGQSQTLTQEKIEAAKQEIRASNQNTSNQEQRDQVQAQQKVAAEAFQATQQEAQQKAITSGQQQTVTSKDVANKKQELLDNKYTTEIKPGYSILGGGSKVEVPEQRTYSIPITDYQAKTYALEKSYAEFQRMNLEGQKQAQAEKQRGQTVQAYDAFRESQKVQAAGGANVNGPAASGTESVKVSREALGPNLLAFVKEKEAEGKVKYGGELSVDKDTGNVSLSFIDIASSKAYFQNLMQARRTDAENNRLEDQFRQDAAAKGLTVTKTINPDGTYTLSATKPNIPFNPNIAEQLYRGTVEYGGEAVSGFIDLLALGSANKKPLQDLSEKVKKATSLETLGNFYTGIGEATGIQSYKVYGEHAKEQAKVEEPVEGPISAAVGGVAGIAGSQEGKDTINRFDEQIRNRPIETIVTTATDIIPIGAVGKIGKPAAKALEQVGSKAGNAIKSGAQEIKIAIESAPSKANLIGEGSSVRLGGESTIKKIAEKVKPKSNNVGYESAEDYALRLRGETKSEIKVNDLGYESAEDYAKRLQDKSEPVKAVDRSKQSAADYGKEISENVSNLQAKYAGERARFGKAGIDAPKVDASFRKSQIVAEELGKVEGAESFKNPTGSKFAPKDISFGESVSPSGKPSRPFTFEPGEENTGRSGQSTTAAQKVETQVAKVQEKTQAERIQEALDLDTKRLQNEEQGTKYYRDLQQARKKAEQQVRKSDILNPSKKESSAGARLGFGNTNEIVNARLSGIKSKVTANSGIAGRLGFGNSDQTVNARLNLGKTSKAIKSIVKQNVKVAQSQKSRQRQGNKSTTRQVVKETPINAEIAKGMQTFKNQSNQGQNTGQKTNAGLATNLGLSKITTGITTRIVPNPTLTGGGEIKIPAPNPPTTPPPTKKIPPIPKPDFYLGGNIPIGRGGKKSGTAVSELSVANIAFPSLSIDTGKGDQAAGAKKLLSNAKKAKKGKGLLDL